MDLSYITAGPPAGYGVIQNIRPLELGLGYHSQPGLRTTSPHVNLAILWIFYDTINYSVRKMAKISYCTNFNLFLYL